MANKKITFKNPGLLSSILASEDDDKLGAMRADTSAAPAVDEDYDIGKSDNKSGRGMGWYVVHTYSGYENQVKKSIEKTVKNGADKHLEEKILEVKIPMQDVIEIKAKGKKSTEKKIFPGYVLVHMNPDDNDAWYVVRNTRGVTGFVGPGSKPVPLEEDEVALLENDEAQKPVQKADFEVGDTIKVIGGVWNDTVGVVSRIDENKGTAIITVEMFGRETPAEISFADIKKLD